MNRTRHLPVQVIRKLRTAEQLLNQGQSVADLCRAWGVCSDFSPLAAPVRRDADAIGRSP